MRKDPDSGLTGPPCRPLELVAIMLPIYDLVNSNKAFSSFLLHDKPSENSPGKFLQMDVSSAIKASADRLVYRAVIHPYPHKLHILSSYPCSSISAV